MVEPKLQPTLADRLRRTSFYRTEWVEPHGEVDVPVPADMAEWDNVSSTLVNPDGPEAADALEAISAENAKLREVLEPFASAARKGQAVYDGVKALLKECPELSTYSTAYIDAGRSTAAACLCWNDYANALAALKEPRS